MLLIGSHAVNHHVPGFRKAPGDVDVIATAGEVDYLRSIGWTDHAHDGSNIALESPRGTIWDIELMSPLTHALREHVTHGDVIEGVMVCILSMDAIYTLKLSHRYLKDSPHFAKTMADIRWFRSRGCNVFDSDWLKERERATYSYQHPNLKRDKAEFFRGDSVQYVYDHDSLHEAVKMGDVPAYTRFSADGHEVLSSRSRFDALPEEHKLHAVLEESYVLALERSQIPFAGQVSPVESFKIALQKVCTSITSGWFREYAWENYYAVLLMFSPSYVDAFHSAMASGVVKLHTA